MDKQPVGQLPDLTQSNNDDEIMVITNSEYSQLKKEKISDLITDFTSTNENNALTKGTDGKMFVTDFGNASNITEGTLPTSVLPEIPLEKIPDIPKDKLPEIETNDLPDSGITAGTYTYPTDIVVNSKGQVTSITEGQAGANNANQDLSNLSEAGENHFANPDLSNLTAEGEKHFLNKTQITNCILEAPNGVATYSGSTITVKQGLKFLIPNGRNADGTLNNIETILPNDISRDVGTSPDSTYIALVNNTEEVYSIDYVPLNTYYESSVKPTSSTARRWLDTENNYYYSLDSGVQQQVFSTKVLTFVLKDGQITSFTPYQPVELIKRTDPQIQAPYITETYINGPSWYRVWSDGWIEQGGVVTAPADNQTTVTLLRAHANTNYSAVATQRDPTMNVRDDAGTSIIPIANNQITIRNGNVGNVPICWRTAGY